MAGRRLTGFSFLRSRGALALSTLFLLGCTAERYAGRAERSARRTLAPRVEQTLGTREADAVHPAFDPERPADAPEEGVVPPPPAPVAQAPGEPDVDVSQPLHPDARVLTLRDALAIAYTTNREMLGRKESLHLQALSLAGVRHAYTPQLALALSYLFDETPDARDSNAGSASFSASQVLPTGGDLRLSAGSSSGALEGDSASYGTMLSVRLTQPLLRGAGYEVAWEGLRQAERDLVYSIRDFELFREDFSIRVAQSFYDLVNRKQSIVNQRRNLESNEFAHRQAEAFFAVGRVNELEVLRARRSELNARNALLEAEEGVELALDRFRIFLGLPEQDRVDVQPDPPPFTPVHYDVESAVEVAFVNRLDYLNRREQLEDVVRGLRITRNRLLPDLSLSTGLSYATSGGFERLGGSDLDRTNLDVGVTLEVPIDRVDERNAYRAAQIGLDQRRRSLEEFEDELSISIRSSFRELDRRLESLEIQRQLIGDQTKQLRIAELLFERGENQNRDVVEANQALLDAQNALIDEQVSYEIARLQLLRDLGILFIDEQGMWK